MRIVEIRADQFDRYCSDIARLLVDAVRNDASVGFVVPIEGATAQAWVESLRGPVESGQRILWVAKNDVGVFGTVQLELCQKPNGGNRAEVQKLLVHSNSRRSGIGAMLMHAVEARATAAERGLIYLDTEAGSPAEAFYRALGYTYAGGLPEYACSPQGLWRANAIYFKSLFLRSRT